MTPIEELQQLRAQFKKNFDEMEERRSNNVAIWERIKQVEAVIKQEPLSFDGKEKTIDNGGKCFICLHNSTVVCQICLLSDIPCGYCDRHRNNHNTEFGARHQAVFRIVKKEEISYSPRIKEPQSIEEMDAKIAELRKRLGQ